jgi:signal transduction histidine kinase
MLDDLGLIAALRWYTNQARSIGLNAVFTSNTPAMRLDATLETACYRIVQEALTNVVRHAKARWVAVDLRQNGSEFHVTIADNGVGFDLENIQQRAGASACLGLLGMQERAALSGGRVEIKSLPGHGTEVHARFPIGPPVQQCHDSTVQRLNDSTL